MNIDSLANLQKELEKTDKLYLLIYKPGADQSECALDRIRTINEDGKFPVFLADVTKAGDIHPAYGITTAPSLLEFAEGKLVNVYKGCQSASFYESAISGKGFTTLSNEPGKPAKRVTVYTTPTCTWCNTLKTYLNENNIRYTEINVAADQAKAEEMVKKSGQQGVPQTDINGQIVVGFDRNRINQLLDIQA